MASKLLIQCIADSERFNIVGQVNDQEEMNELVKGEKSSGRDSIYCDFTKDIKPVIFRCTF